MASIKEKIISIDAIAGVIEAERKKSPRPVIVSTNGAFDILHAGHITSLELAKSYGNLLVLGLNSDASVRSYKAADRPFVGQEDRAYLLAALAVVDYVVIFDEPDPRRLLGLVKPDVHVKSRSGYKGIEQDVVVQNGGRIELIDDVPGLSTSALVAKIRSSRE